MDNCTNLPLPRMAFELADLRGAIYTHEGQDTIFHRELKGTVRSGYDEAKNVGWVDNDFGVIYPADL